MTEQENGPRDYRAVVGPGYDRVVDQYEALEAAGHEWPRLRWLDKLLARLTPDSRALDVGCGSGVPADVRIAQCHRVTGVDVSAEQIRRARTSVPDGEFICADVSALEFAPGSFDAVVSFYTIEHVPRRQHARLFERFHGWTREGGFLLLSLEAGDLDDVRGEWLGVPMFVSCYDPETTTALVRRAGYEILETAVERQLEGDHEVPYLWILGRRALSTQR